MRRESAFAAAAGLAAALAYSVPVGAQAVLAAVPVLPAYGQAVAIELTGTNWPTYLPATRYTKTGSAIDIDYEYLTDGFGPTRPDFGDLPLSLGELAPGTYQVRAHLHDLGNLSAPPTDVSTSIAVVPPPQWGIYTLPLQPQAFSATEAIVRSAAYFDPASMKASVSGNVVRVDFDYRSDATTIGSVVTNMSSFGSVLLPDLAPGAYSIEGWGRASAAELYEKFFTRDFIVAPTVPVIEFYSATLDHYFIAAGADEIALLDRGGQGDWKRTGLRFAAWWRQSDASADAVPACRFYAQGPNSHFYTGSLQECDYLKALEQQQRAEASARGEPFLGWGYEGIAFWTVVPRNGRCPAGMSPVYRMYNDRAAEMDSNHRFTMDADQHAAMSVDWLDEGAQLCSVS